MMGVTIKGGRNHGVDRVVNGGLTHRPSDLFLELVERGGGQGGRAPEGLETHFPC